MTDSICSAPGKIFLGGEYAVLSGSEAVVAAVDRRAVAKILEKRKEPSPIVAAVRDEVSGLHKKTGARFNDAPYLEVVSDRFSIRKKKIGLGSSAAVTAAAAGAFFEINGLPIADNRADILKAATIAHKKVQGGRGSGADVAASVVGGIIVFAMDREPEPLSLTSVSIAVVWSGRAASTRVLIDRIQDFEKRDPTGHGKCFKNLRVKARELADAYRADSLKRIIEATAGYGRSMDELGRASKASIVTYEHKLIARLALDAGGAAKPSGAGGGDIAVAVFPDSASMNEFRRNCRRHELVPLDLALGAEGLRRELP